MKEAQASDREPSEQSQEFEFQKPTPAKVNKITFDDFKSENRPIVKAELQKSKLKNEKPHSSDRPNNERVENEKIKYKQLKFEFAPSTQHREQLGGV